MVDLLSETIEATDQGLTNQEEEDVSTCCSGCTTSCPEAPDITINNTTLDLGDGTEAAIVTEHFESESGTAEVANTPVEGFEPEVHRDGAPQKKDVDWTRSGKVFTFIPALSSEDVSIRYAYEVA